MKEYGDEGFINLLREEREETVKNIKDGTVLVAGENIDFQEREVLQGKMWMWMPDGFGPLSKELARLKYPNENRPDVIYTNQETTVNITFSHKRETLKEGQEEEIRGYMKEIVEKVQPASEMLEAGTVEAEKGRLAWFDFVTPAIDTDIYNLMFFTSVRGRLCSGSFHCESSRAAAWKPVILKTFQSFREWEDKYEG